MPWHPLIPPKKIEKDKLIDSVTERGRRTADISNLSKGEYREDMEERLAALAKEVPAFKAIAVTIIATKERFWISAITARVIDREKHMVAELSSNLADNPVFVTPVYYDKIDKEYIYNLFVPTSEEISEITKRLAEPLASDWLKL